MNRLAYILPFLMFVACGSNRILKPEDMLCGKWRAIQVKTVLRSGRMYEYHYIWEFTFKVDGTYTLQINAKETGQNTWWESGEFSVSKGKIFFFVTDCPDRNFVGGSYALSYEVTGDFLVLGGRVFRKV